MGALFCELGSSVATWRGTVSVSFFVLFFEEGIVKVALWAER